MGRKQLREKRKQRKQDQRVRLSEGFWKRLLRALPALLVTILLTFLLVRSDHLHEFAAESQDLLLRLTTRPQASRVAVVMIGDEEYESEFKKDGSLNPAKLQELISAIAKGNPKLIGVDIDTSDQRYRNFQPPESRRPVVWVRAVYEPVTERPTPRDVLGGADPQLNNGPHSGLPLLYDVNKVTRLYQRLIDTTEGELPSFPWSVAKTLDPKVGERRPANTDRLIIRFAGAQSEELSATQILQVANEPWWPDNKQIKDKIVLIGVSYLGQDRHETPLGEKSGVHNMAAAIETELDGGGVPQPGDLAFLPLWIMQGLALVLLFHFFPLSKAIWKNLAWSLALAVGSALVCSVIASFVAARSLTYLSLVYLPYFLPVGVFIFIEELRERLNDWRKEKLAHVYGEVRAASPADEKSEGS
jgi:CHASE2 domain-containing sensor protein